MRSKEFWCWITLSVAWFERMRGFPCDRRTTCADEADPSSAAAQGANPVLILALPVQSGRLAEVLVNKLPAAALAGLVATLSTSGVAQAVDVPPPAPMAEAQQSQTMQFPSESAPPVASGGSQLPEGGQWRYSEFLGAVENGKVERVRFSKDGSMLQLTAVDGKRAQVVLPNDPELVDTLARNGVDISVSEGEQGGSAVSLIGNLLFPLVAFGGLFFLFRRSQGGQGGGPMGGMGGPMDFGKNKSKFQEVPETGVTFQDVAVSFLPPLDFISLLWAIPKWHN